MIDSPDNLPIIGVSRKKDYQSNQINIGMISELGVKSRKEAGYDEYMLARAEVLRKLYEELQPDEYTYEWVLPDGETDGRKAVKVPIENLEIVSPFDLPDLEELMPPREEYVRKFVD